MAPKEVKAFIRDGNRLDIKMVVPGMTAIQKARRVIDNMPHWQKLYAEEIIKSATDPEYKSPLPRMLE